ncbi:MAG TPA: hypothetical protein V6C57_09730, partial [Coleofasciculaceae cyanobacterium]
WFLNSLFFSSTIFTLKFRKDKQHAVTLSCVYHVISALLVIGLWFVGWLSPMTAFGFSVVLLKFGIIFWQKNWYCTTKIQFIALLETISASVFLAIVALSVLPAHLPVD